MKKDILSSSTFRKVFYFKFFMVIFVWGLFPLFIPRDFIPFFGLHLSDFQVLLLRVWGAVVLLDFFLYWYIFNYPYKKLSKLLLLFAIIDNAGLGIVLLLTTILFSLPWGIWINIPFQLFFGYWFWQFYNKGEFTQKYY